MRMNVHMEIKILDLGNKNFSSQKFNFSVPFRLLKYGKITEINYFHSRF